MSSSAQQNMGFPQSKYSADRKVTAQKNQQLRESAYKLVVKVIRWRSGVKGDKITTKEWKEYKKHLLASIPTDETRKYQQILGKLKETQQAILKYGGFA